MGKFRDFLLEYTPARPFAGGTQHTGAFGLPDLVNYDHPGQRPAGGFGTFQQVAQAAATRHGYNQSDLYIVRETLTKCRALAENVMSAINLRAMDVRNDPEAEAKKKHYERHYWQAYYDQSRGVIGGITRNEIIGGDYPRFRNEEMTRAVQLKIVYTDPLMGEGFWAIDMNKLRNEMFNHREALAKMQKNAERMQHLGGMADNALQAATSSPVQMPDFTKAS